VRHDRVERLRGVLAGRRLDGAVFSRPANVFYLSGRTAAFLVLGPERPVLVAAGPPTSDDGCLTLGYAVPGLTVDRVADVGRGSAEALAEALRRAGLAGQRVGVEEDHLTARQAAAVAAVATPVGLDGEVEALRRIKDDGEVAAIRRALSCNDVGFAAARAAIRPGATELEVMNAVVAAMQADAGQPIDVLGPTNAFVSGPRTLLAAAPATPRPLEPGDLMIVDLNPFVGAYKGDTTRTFSVGEPSPARRRVHDALARGLAAAEAVARPGVPASRVHAALVGPIEAAGCGALRFHGGHALGLEHVERPFVVPGDDMPLAEGMVVALEPGVYLPGVGGLRLEENYLVRAEGLEALSRFPRELVVCPDVNAG
jgi:Xaa-Pro aminopeptidase